MRDKQSIITKLKNSRKKFAYRISSIMQIKDTKDIDIISIMADTIIELEKINQDLEQDLLETSEQLWNS